MESRTVPSINASIFIAAAEDLNLDVSIIDHEYSYIKISNKLKELFLLGNKVSFNNGVSSSIARSKFFSLKLLSRENIRVPYSKLFKVKAYSSNEELIKDIQGFIQKSNLKDIVVKPNDGSLGKGVFIKPKPDEIEHVFKEIIKLNTKGILIEEYIEGIDYRILVFQKKVIEVLERIPANIIGNGKDTLNSLVRNYNVQRLKNSMKPVKIDEYLIRYIKRNYNLDLNSKVSRGKKVQLRKVSNFAQGGNVKKIPLEIIDSRFIEIFQKISDLLCLEYVGIDLITTDISKFNYDNYSINEVNSNAMIDVHYFASEGRKKLFTAKKVLSTYFGLS